MLLLSISSNVKDIGQDVSISPLIQMQEEMMPQMQGTGTGRKGTLGPILLLLNFTGF